MKKQNILAIAFIALIISIINFNLSAQCVNCDANSSASGSYASAMGMSANATGQASLAVGLEAYADGNYSFALGKYVTSTGASSVTLGRYLETATSPAMIIGTGYNSSNYLVNSNSNSLMIGFNSNKSTLFVKGATGIGYTGKVGIGDVTDPQAKLHIKADDGEAASLFLESYSFGGSYAADLWMGTQDYGLRAMYGKLYFNTGGNYIFNSANANVGIGVLTPHEKLEVSGNIKTTGFILENGQQATNKILQSDSHGQASWVDPMTLIVDDGDWVVNGNNMYSSVTGNIGIGVPSPVEKLDVNGTIKSVGFKLIDGNQAAGKILQSDASGNASWTNLPPAGDDD